MAVVTPSFAAGKVVLVTGASAGIGRGGGARAGPARLWPARTDRPPRRSPRSGWPTSSAPLGAEVETIVADLEDPAAPERIVAGTVGRFGGLDVLINNAGFGLPTVFSRSRPRRPPPPARGEFRSPRSCWRGRRLPSLIERRGTIINVGSAITTWPTRGSGPTGRPRRVSPTGTMPCGAS